MTHKQTSDSGRLIAKLEEVAKSAADNGNFDKGLDRLAQKPDDKKPAFGGKRKRASEQ